MPSSSKPPSYSSALREEYEKILDHSTSHGKSEHKRDRKIRSTDSTVSRSDSVASDALKSIAGDKIRRGRCAPGYLQQVARSGEIEALDKSNRKVTLIDGPEATKFYEKYLSEHSAGVNKIERSKSDGDLPLPEPASIPAVVFAVTAIDAGRKVVDYYMTWRGKKDPTNHLRGSDRRQSMLDAEFKDVARSLDKAFKRGSSLRSVASAPSSSKHAENKKSRTESKSKSHKSSHSPTEPPAESSTRHATQSAGIPSVVQADSPAEARSSVVSLPLLNMIRGVPLSHRMPLRVTNPDTASILSADTIVEEPTQIEVADQGAPNPERPLTPASVTPSSATDESNTGTLISEKPIVPSHASSETSRHRHHGKRHRSDDASSKHSRRSRKDSDGSSSIDIVIVLLDEDVDTKSDDTWHGLERRASKGPVRKPSQTASPWSGPLAHADLTYRSPMRLAVIESDDSDSSDDEWKDSPVVPLGSLMAALSSTSEPSVNFLSSVPTINYPHTPSMMGSPAPHAHHMVYSSPYVPATPLQVSSPYAPATPLQVLSPYAPAASLQVSSPYAPATPLHVSSPYPPAWGTPLGTSLSPLPRSNSRTSSIMSYHSPYTPPY
ncbi:hypothetical protein BD779DRAFT_1667079 [Infundibulicybe gibba]|nr:hypothetical protein BD779DRAFT_1667079 [Infundibulicybe gibba]